MKKTIINISLLTSLLFASSAFSWVAFDDGSAYKANDLFESEDYKDSSDNWQQCAASAVEAALLNKGVQAVESISFKTSNLLNSWYSKTNWYNANVSYTSRNGVAKTETFKALISLYPESGSCRLAASARTKNALILYNLSKTIKVAGIRRTHSQVKDDFDDSWKMDIPNLKGF